MAWCHGAPGIGLARARACICDPQQRDEHETLARAAMDTLLAGVPPLLSSPRYDSTLCHGLTGLSEILLITGSILETPAYIAAAEEMTESIAFRYESAGDWPTGAPGGGWNPSLMIGLAGIGHHMLRLGAREAVPPVMIIIP